MFALLCSDREVLLRAHSAIVLASLRYGETAYGSAKEGILQQLEPIYNNGLRIAIGAFCVTKTSELLKEVESHSLKELRNKSIAISGLRIREKHAHPIRPRPDSSLRELISRRPHLPAPFNARVVDSLEEYGIANNKIHEDSNWSLAPWQQLDEGVLDTDNNKWNNTRSLKRYTRTVPKRN
jgi:hypothetical protein